MLSSQHDSKDPDSCGSAGRGCGSASDGCECGEAAGCGGGAASEQSGAQARSFVHGATPKGDARAAVDEREAALPSCTEAFESQPLADSGYKIRPCDWDSRHVWAFDKAFTQIRNNLDIVDDYFADLARDGDCIKRYFDGTKELHLVPLTECEDVHYSAKAFYGINRIRLNKHFVTAVYNSYHDSDCGSGDGACACAIVGLAGLLLHEASHICADNEILAHLLQAFYQFKFKENHGYEPADWCCAQNFGAEGGWAPGDWSRVTLNAAFGGDGQQSVDALPHSDTEPWRLGVCGRRPVEWYSP